jgi:6-phospho-beta-glucosidase
MRDLKLCIVGAGGSYTPELIEGLLAPREQPFSIVQIALCDIDAKRLEIMTGLTRRMIAAAGRRIEVQSSRDVATAAAAADFVVAQIRVGGMQARRLDEAIPLKYGVIGQETTGPGGMFKALRTIPVMIDIARTIAEVAPQAFILNYTNPSGIVTEAVLNHTQARLLGLCSSIPGMQARLGALLAPEFGQVSLHSVGLNHLGFIHRITAGGRDVTEPALAWARRHDDGSDPLLTSALRTSAFLGSIPVAKYGDLYFHRRHEVAQAVAAPRSRAETVQVIETDILAEAADPHTNAKPRALAQRGGDGYSNVTFSVMSAIVENSGAAIVMSTLNRGAVDDLPDDVAVETVCRVDASGAFALPVGRLPLAFRGLVQAVKTHETLTVQAAVTRRRDLALQALLAHPLVGDLDVAEPMLDELLVAHGLHYT